MRVLVTGAGGFIGQHLTASLLEAGHEVVGAVRDPEALRRRFPEVSAIRVDLNRDTEREVWTPRLQGVEAVVNCAGILQGGRGQSIEAVHHLGPRALFEACVEASVRRVIQVSAISADEAAGTAFASSKKRADDALRSLDLDWVVLRPSLVYARGSYGGTSLMRALAAIPWVLPVPGDGAQPFRPIHVSDLVRTVLWILETPGIRRLILEPVGPEELSLRELLLRFRAWLGLPKARAVSVPLPLIRIATRIGDWLGSGPINSTALTQLEYGNAAPFEPFVQAVGFRPRSFGEALRDEPSEAQDFLARAPLFPGPGTACRARVALARLGCARPALRQPARQSADRGGRHRDTAVHRGGHDLDPRPAGRRLGALRASAGRRRRDPDRPDCALHARADGPRPGALARPLRAAPQEPADRGCDPGLDGARARAVIDAYLILKWLHVLSATLLFGTGLGTAFQMWFAHRHGDPRAIAVVARNVVLADWLFTAPSGVLQPVTGVALVLLGGHDWRQSWLLASIALYLLAGVLWLIVVWLQIRVRALAKAAVEAGTPLPEAYERCMRLWFALGWPAFIGLIVVFWLMVARPELW